MGGCKHMLEMTLADLGYVVWGNVVELSDRWPVARARWLGAVVDKKHVQDNGR